MASKPGAEARVTIGELARLGCRRAQIARLLAVAEGAVRYHLRWKDSLDEDAVNVAALHHHLVEEHGYPGSLRSVQRYYRVRFSRPPRRARCRSVSNVSGDLQVGSRNGQLPRSRWPPVTSDRACYTDLHNAP